MDLSGKQFPREIVVNLIVNSAIALPHFGLGYLDLPFYSIDNFWKVYNKCHDFANWLYDHDWENGYGDFLQVEVLDFLLVQEFAGTINSSNYSEVEIEDAVLGLIELSLEYSHQLAGILNAKTQKILDIAKASRTHVGQRLADVVIKKWVDVFEQLID